MNYQVLARKWRPKNFSEVVGQQHVLQALINALDNNRLHHAYLFSGTRGVGKTTLGRIFAKSLNCEQGISSKPCGQCTSCCEIDEGRFVDLLEVDAASRTKVDETRELLENVQYAPTRGRFKVYLIDEVHMLTTHSFNALLKTLEEPPPHVKFILATTDPQKLPVTILSRCLKFNLKAISVDSIVDHMQFILNEENVPTEIPALKLIARSATGSMRDALSLLDQAIAHGNGSVNDTTVREMLGTVNNRDVVGIINALIDDDAPELLNQAQLLASQGAVFSSVLSELVSTLHLLALAQAVPDALEDDDKHLLEISSKMSADDVQLYYQIALMGQKDLPLAPDPRAGFEMVLLRMYAFRPLEDAPGASERQVTKNSPKNTVKPAPENVSAATNRSHEARQALSNLTQAEKTENVPRNAEKPVEKREPVKEVQSAKPNGNVDWDNIVKQLPLVGVARQIVANCVYKGKEAGIIKLRIDSANASMVSDAILQRIAQALSHFYAEDVKIKLERGELDEQSPAEMQAEQQKNALQAAVRDMESDPTVIAMKETFNATLDPGSVRLKKNTS